jgi:hypothetical protein
LGSPIVIVISHVCATPSLDPRKWWLSSLHVTWPYQMRVSSSWNSSFNNTAIPHCGTYHGWFQTLESLLPWLPTSTQIPKNRRLSRDAMPTLSSSPSETNRVYVNCILVIFCCGFLRFLCAGAFASRF